MTLEKKKNKKPERSIIYVELSTFGAGGISFLKACYFSKKKKKVWGRFGAKDNHSYHDRGSAVLPSGQWNII